MAVPRWIVPIATALISAAGGAVAAYYGSGAAGGQAVNEANILENEHRITALEIEYYDLRHDVDKDEGDSKTNFHDVWFAINQNSPYGVRSIGNPQKRQ